MLDNPPMTRLMKVVQRRWRQSTGLFLSRTDQAAETRPPASASVPVENRCHPRVPVTPTHVQVTDGCLCATAEIGNISPCGICLRNLPETLYRDAERLTVFSSDNPGLPVLHIKPRWERTDWSGKTIGAAIVNAPELWQIFFIHAASQARGHEASMQLAGRPPVHRSESA